MVWDVILYLVIGIFVVALSELFDKNVDDSDTLLAAGAVVFWPLILALYTLKLIGLLPKLIARAIPIVGFGIGLGVSWLWKKVSTGGSE